MTQRAESRAHLLGRCASILLIASWIPSSASAGELDRHRQVALEKMGPSGQGAVVTVDEDGYRIASRGMPHDWSHELPAAPNFLQAGNDAATVVVGHLRNDGSPRWATVFTQDGQSWSPPGVVQQIHVSSRGDKVLAQVQIDGRDETLVLTAAGETLARFNVGVSEDHATRFTARMDAVAVTPGPEGGSSVLATYDIETGLSQRHELDPAIPVEDAVALDANHLVILGSGSLTMVLMPNAEEFADEGVFGWTLEGPDYSTLLGATDDGERLLATRGQGRFDLVGRDGRVLWSFDPRSPEQGRRLSRVDLGRAHPYLHADGRVEIKDDSGTGRYVLTWPSTNRVLGSPTVRWEPAE